MRYRTLSQRCAGWALVATLLACATGAQAADKTWAVASGDWFTASNWSPAGVPDIADTVTLNNGTLTLDAAATVASFTQKSGTLAGGGTLTVTGLTTWNGGTMSGAGSTVAMGGLSLNGTAAKSLTRTLSNHAAATWKDAGALSIGGSGTLSNEVGATFDTQTDASVNFGGGSPHFDNAGSFTKSTGTVTAFTVSFNNSGSVTVQAGKLDLSGGGTQTGNFNVTGTTLELGGGTHNFTAAAGIVGTNAIVSGGTANLAGNYNLSGTTTVSGGTANFTGNLISIGALTVTGGTANFSTTGLAPSTPSLLLSGGTLTGSSTLTVTGLLTWTGGTMSGAGTTIAMAGLSMSSAVNKTLNRTLNNEAAATWKDSGTLNMGSGGIFSNHAGATFTVQNDAAVGFAGGSPRFDNTGTFIKSIGALTAFNGVAFNNSGMVEVQSGKLDLSGGGTHTGTFDATGTALEFGAGTHNFTAATSIIGTDLLFTGATATMPGTYNVTGTTTITAGTANFTGNVISVGALMLTGGTANFSVTSGSLTALSLTLTNGNLAGSSTLTVSGALMWSGGAMSGVGTTTAMGGLLMSGNGAKTLNRTLNNVAMGSWMDPGGFVIGTGGVFNNQVGAMFDIQNDAAVSFGGGSPQFNNAGTLIKSIGAMTAVSAVAFNNSGMVRVHSGTLALSGGGTDSGMFEAMGAAVAFSGGTHNLTGTASITASDVVFSNGVVNLAGSYDVTGTTTVSGATAHFTGSVTRVGALTISGGTADFSNTEGAVSIPTLSQSNGNLVGSSALAVGGALTWSGGTMGGTGSTTANGGLALSGNAGKTLTRTLNNAAMATWTDTGTFTVGTGGVVNNQAGAVFDVQTDASLFFGGGAPKFNNAGMFVKSLGTLTALNGIAFRNSGSVESKSGALRFTGGYVQTAGTTRLNGGNVESSTIMDIQGGTLEGTGTVTANVSNGGHVSPGLSPGVLNVTGDYAQTAGGDFKVEIGGRTAGSGFDKLAVAQMATLAGTLSISLINGFTPSLGDRFQILTFAMHSGDFDSATGLAVGNGLGFNKLVGNSDVVLEFAQENCTDGIDNDGDGLVDCQDPKCADVLQCTFTPTVTPTSSATPTRTPTPTASATGLSSPIATATATATVPQGTCTGDCNGDGEVTIDELITGVSIALGDAPLERCAIFDQDGSGMVEINELITGVNNALNGCGGAIPPTSTPTPAPGAAARAVAGHTTIIADALAVIPNLLAGLVNGIQFVPSSAFEPLAAAGCPLGGSARRTGTLPTVAITLTGCRAATADGTVTFDGTASLHITTFTVNITVTFRDVTGAQTLVTNAMMMGTISPLLGGNCFLINATLHVASGSVSVTTPNATQLGVTFQNTTLAIDNVVFNAGCVPITYRITINGAAALQAPSGVPVAVDFNDFVMSVDDSMPPTLFQLNGGITSSCFGGAVSVTTLMPLSVASGEICPRAGTLAVDAPAGPAQVFYRSDASVDIDVDGNGTIDETAPTCLDPRLLMCLA